MRGMKKNVALLFLSTALLVSSACKTSFDEVTYNNGDAEFARFLSVGSGYMAGYADNALYRDAQLNSIPALLSERFALVGGGPFLQPLVNPGAGLGLDGNAKYMLTTVANACATGTNLKPYPVSDTADVTNYNWLGNLYSFNNLAVPGAHIYDLNSQEFGDPSPFLGNALYSRFASMPATSTVAGDATLLIPTFVALWVGMDDIYDYAISGGDQGSDSLTKPVSFGDMYSSLVEQVIPQTAGAVLANIPSLNSIPFFTSISWNGLVLNAAQATELNSLYAIVDPSISFTVGNNPYIIADPAEPTGRRKIRNGEYILLSTPRDSMVCNNWGTLVPIPEKYVLDGDEALSIDNAVNGYNAFIATEATAGNYALADMNALFKTLNKGILFNGVNYTTKYLKESAFSTDGFYLNQGGYAILANEFLRVINLKYSSNLPLIDANSFQGIVFP